VTQQIIVGEVADAFGVQGWVKVYSHTVPPKNILDYSPWLLAGVDGTKEYKMLSGRIHGQYIVAHLEGVDDRDKALKLKTNKISVPRESFPPVEAGSFYWVDLVGLRITNLQGIDLGIVDEMMATGANDVIVAKADRERLIPFVMGQFVKEVNLDEGRMLVDWDADF